jgi:hypothetical protein
VRYNFDQRTKKTVRRLFVAALALGCGLGTAAHASAQSLTPEAGNVQFLSTHALGTQGYICLPQGAGAAWNVNARPEATLFQKFFGQDLQVITHFLSPDTNPNKVAPDPLPFGNATWQSSFDTSKVWAQKVKGIQAGTDPAICPNAGAIDCLLLQSIGSLAGPAGGKFLTATTFIQRLNTKGGSAPADGCSVSSDVGKQALVPYSADYIFFKADTK